MTRDEQKTAVQDLLGELQWLASNENAERMEDKDKRLVGICVDAMMIVIDFAEKREVPLLQLLDYVLVQTAAERGFPEELRKAWWKVDKVYRKSMKEQAEP